MAITRKPWDSLISHASHLETAQNTLAGEKKKCGTKAELSNEGAGNPRQAEPDTISALGTVPWRAAAHPGKLGISRTSEACSPGGGRWFLNAESLIF